MKNEGAHNKHHKIKHPGKPYTCQICRKPFSEKDKYYKHKIQNHNKPFGCNACSYTASKVIMMQNHIQKIHVEKLKKWAKKKSISDIENTPMGSDVIVKLNETSISNDKANSESDSKKLIEEKDLPERMKKMPKELKVDIKHLKVSELVDKVKDTSLCNVDNTTETNTNSEQHHTEGEIAIEKNSNIHPDIDMKENVDEHETTNLSIIEDKNNIDKDNADYGSNGIPGDNASLPDPLDESKNLTKNNIGSNNSNELEDNEKKITRRSDKVHNLKINEDDNPENLKDKSEKVTKNETENFVNSGNEFIGNTNNTDEIISSTNSDFEKELSENQTEEKQAELSHSIFDSIRNNDDAARYNKEENQQNNCDASFEELDSFGDGFADDDDQHYEQGKSLKISLYMIF